MPVTPKRAAAGKAREVESPSRRDLQDVSNCPSPNSSPRRKNCVTGSPVEAENHPPSPRIGFEDHATTSRARAVATNLTTVFERLNLNDAAGVQTLRTPHKPKRHGVAQGPVSPVKLRDGKVHVQSPAVPPALSLKDFNRKINQTLVETHLHCNYASPPPYQINILSTGPSGAHGATRRIQLLSYDGKRNGPLAFAKLVKRQRLRDALALADLRAYGRIARATANSDGSDSYIVDLEAFVDVPKDSHVIFIFDLAMCDMYSVLCNPGKYDAEGFVKVWAAQLISGLGYLHSIGIIHRDMKPENCVLDWNNHAKITDFDTAFVSSERGPLNYTAKYCHRPDVGTVGFMAPEVYQLTGSAVYVQLFKEDPFERTGLLAGDDSQQKDRRRYGAKVDFFSMGVLLYDIHAALYSEIGDFGTREERLNGLVKARRQRNYGYRPGRIPEEFYQYLRQHKIYDTEFSHLLARMIDPEPRTRADFETIRKHPYFETKVTFENGERHAESLLDSPALVAQTRARGISRKHYEDEMPTIPTIKVDASVLPPDEDPRSYLWENPKTKLFDFLKH